MPSTSYSKLFSPTEIPSTGVTLWTNAGASGTVLRNGIVQVVNTTTATRQVTLHAVPSGASPSASNMIADAESVPVADSISYRLPIMGVGDYLYALADADASLTIHHIAGNLYTP